MNFVFLLSYFLILKNSANSDRTKYGSSGSQLENMYSKSSNQYFLRQLRRLSKKQNSSIVKIFNWMISFNGAGNIPYDLLEGSEFVNLISSIFDEYQQLNENELTAYFGIISILSSPYSSLREVFINEEFLSKILLIIKNPIKKVKIHALTTVSQIISTNPEFIPLLISSNIIDEIRANFLAISFRLQIISLYVLIASSTVQNEYFQIAVEKISQSFPTYDDSHKSVVINCFSSLLDFFPDLNSIYINSGLLQFLLENVTQIDISSVIYNSFIPFLHKFIATISESNISVLETILPLLAHLFELYTTSIMNGSDSSKLEIHIISIFKVFSLTSSNHTKYFDNYVFNQQFIQEIIYLIQNSTFNIANNSLEFVYRCFEKSDGVLLELITQSSISEKLIYGLKFLPSEQANHYLSVIISFVDTFPNGVDVIRNFIGEDLFEDLLHDVSDPTTQEIIETIINKIV